LRIRFSNLINTARSGDDPTETRRNAGRRGHPDTGGGRQSQDLPFIGDFQNGSAAQESDARDDALNDAGHVARAHARLRSRNHQERRAHRNENVRAKSGRVMSQLALQTDAAADDQGREQPQSHPHDLRTVRQRPEIVLPSRSQCRYSPGFSTGSAPHICEYYTRMLVIER
jgi:hypothetical protein